MMVLFSLVYPNYSCYNYIQIWEMRGKRSWRNLEYIQTEYIRPASGLLFFGGLEYGEEKSVWGSV